jgi:CHAD domain-containing protein
MSSPTEGRARARLTPALLDLPAPHAVRVIARALLDEMSAARERLEKDDADALHDVRVAVRQLRAWLRAFRPELADTVRGRTRRRLRDFTRTTNEARDVEVALGFLARETGLPARARAASRAVTTRLERERDDHLRQARRTFARDVEDAARELERQLGSYWERHRIDERSSVRPMSAVFADAAQRQAKQAVSAMKRHEPPGKPEHLHRARIAAKRLRYLLESLGGQFGAESSLAQLRELQQQLGDARDAHMIAMRFIREIGEGAARDARASALARAGIVPDDADETSGPTANRSGLTELARRANEAHATALSRFVARWDENAVTALGNDVAEVIARATRVE